MGADQAINDKLKHLQVDDEEAGVDHEMENGRNRSLEHLLLTEGHQEHIAPPLAGTVVDFVGFAKPNGSCQEEYPPADEENSAAKDKQEDQLSNHEREGMKFKLQTNY
jgi:hypothetical protein